MIESLTPFEYEIPDPVPEEIRDLRSSQVERYFIAEISASAYLEMAEGFFRLHRSENVSSHVAYVKTKIAQLRKKVELLEPDETIVRVDYYTSSPLMIGVYIQKRTQKMLGCIKGYCANKMTKDDFDKVWHRSPS